MNTKKTKVEPKGKVTKSITVPLPEELLEKVRRKAEKNDISMNQVVRKLLTQWASEKQNTFNF